MNENKIVIGIDTSNYTTSLSVMDLDGVLLANLKMPLPVKAGECGLRQSDAVFAHVKNIPEIMKRVAKVLEGRRIVAVGVSSRPRNVDGSYMPCFLSGVAVAESLSATLGVPLYRFSHQCGHVMAALYSSGRLDLLDGRPFAAFHVSGGTTEMLSVKADDDGFVTELVGGTADLNAGQVIDRTGVMMGLPFPAGAHIEELALKNTLPVPNKKPKISEFKINLSGLENLARDLYQKTEDKSLTSAFVLSYVGKGLSMLADAYEEKFGKSDFVFAGGVMCNSIIKRMLSDGRKASFAEPLMSADNAVGIAALTLRAYKK